MVNVWVFLRRQGGHRSNVVPVTVKNVHKLTCGVLFLSPHAELPPDGKQIHHLTGAESDL